MASGVEMLKSSLVQILSFSLSGFVVGSPEFSSSTKSCYVIYTLSPNLLRHRKRSDIENRQ